ncbi:MAG: hypothetical protein M3Z08_15355 [Chloroflexota bacterium]|nr:hypothetical protein [Chloroflexota bacterium]
MRTQRTQPALPGATLPTAPMPGYVPGYIVGLQPASSRRSHSVRRAVVRLLGLALLLEGVYLALYPLFAGTTAPGDAAKQALLRLFPWLPALYWTTAFPALGRFLARVPWLNPGADSGLANLLLALLVLAFVLVLVAAGVGRRVAGQQISCAGARALFWCVLALALVFGLTYVCAPSLVSRDVFLYAFSGRVVVLYHANPYTAAPALFAHDPLRAVILSGVSETLPYGPVWLDIGIPLALFARGSLANILIEYRLLALVVHLLNAALVWAILAKMKPQTRVAAMILYAWNPVLLLLGIGEMHMLGVVILFVLLAAFFFQRNSLLLSWVFLLLAALINGFCLLFLPIFLRLLWREVRLSPRMQRFLWWLAAAGITSLILVLAYAPYWQGWGLPGVVQSLRQTFWQSEALNSLDAALLHLPIALPPALSWLTAPHHWTMLALAAVVLLVLMGTWLTDSLALALLFNCWLFLALVVLLPDYWPWYVLLLVTLALCTANSRTILLTLLLALGTLLSYYCLLWRVPWSGQALLTVGLPLLVWGWVLFFASTWQMMRVRAGDSRPLTKAKSLSRSSWPSRPPRSSWPTRRPSEHGRS